MVFGYVVVQGDLSVAKFEQTVYYVMRTNPFALFRDSSRISHDTLALYCVALGISFGWVLCVNLIWALTKAQLVKPQVFKLMHFCFLVLTSVFVDIFPAPR